MATKGSVEVSLIYINIYDNYNYFVNEINCIKFPKYS